MNHRGGVAGVRPAATRRRATSGSAAAPMRTTRVSTAPARCSQSTRPPGLPGSSCPVTTANEEATPRCVTGMPGGGRHRHRGRHARDHVAGNPRRRCRLRGLLAAAPEHEGVAPLEADHQAPGLGVAHEEHVDGGLRHAVVARRLPAKMRRLAAAPRRGAADSQMVVDDHLGAAEPPEPSQRDQLGSPGPAPPAPRAPSAPRAAPAGARARYRPVGPDERAHSPPSAACHRSQGPGPPARAGSAARP